MFLYPRHLRHSWSFLFISVHFSGSRHTKIWPKYCVTKWGIEPRSPWQGRYMLVSPTPYQLLHCNCWTPYNFLLNINLMFEFRIFKLLP
jgi:hypothetical protein